MLLDHIVKHGLALTEGHFGVLVHKSYNVGEGSCALADALLNSPQPSNVDVAVTREDNLRGCRPRNFCELFEVNPACLGNGFSDLRLVKIVIDNVQAVVNCGINEGINMLVLDKFKCLEGNLKVVPIALAGLVCNPDIG